MGASIRLTPVYKLLPLILFAVLTILMSGRVQAQEFAQCPATVSMPPTATVSEKILDDGCIPGGFGGNPIDFFDDYSWRAFLGLVWPAKADERGIPDATAKLSDKGRPLVFETFKSDWEIFQPQGATPATWNSVAGTNPCKLADLSSNDLVLAAFSKFDNLGQAGFGPPLVGQLVAQNRTYVRYQTAFNKIEFDPIKNDRLYLRSSLLGTKVFQSGAIDIKNDSIRERLIFSISLRIPVPLVG
jgi:hypothetical protein